MKTLWRAVAATLLLSLALVGFAPATPTLAAPAEQARLAVPILVVNTSFLNVRSGPGAQYTSIVTLVGGTELPVLGIAKDKVWYYVATAVGNGWVNINFLLARGDFSNVPMIDTSNIVAAAVIPVTGPVTIGLPGLGQGGGAPVQGAAAIPISTGYYARFRARVMASSLDVFNSPSQRAGKVTTLFRDDPTDYAIIGSTSNEGIQWLQIITPNGAGWVEDGKIFKALSAQFGTVVTVAAKVIALNLDSGGADILVEGDEAYLLGNNSDGRVHVQLGNGRSGTLPFDSVRVRNGTTTDNWGQGGSAPVQPPGVVGAPSVPTLALPIAIINTGAVNIRLGPGPSYTSIAVVQGGSQLTILGYARDQIWYLVQGDFGQGWVYGQYILIRGNLDNAALINDAYANGGVAAVG